MLLWIGGGIWALRFTAKLPATGKSAALPWPVALQQWLPVAFWIGAGLFLIAAAAVRWLEKAPGPEAQTGQPAPDASCGKSLSGRLCGGIVLIAMIVAGLRCAPRLHHSLWLDEEFSMRHFIVGEYKAAPGQPDAALRWNEVTLSETLWNYNTPNNHGLFSLLARLSHGGAKKSDAPDAAYFREWRLRLPVFIAALLGLPALWLLLKRLGLGAGAVAAPVLLSLHPWFIRFAAEARGYGLLFLLWPLAVLAAVEALRTGRWRWWLALAVLQGLLLWAWMMQVYWLAALNAGIFFVLWHRRTDRPLWLARWLASGALAVVLVLPFILPAYAQISAWAAQGRAKAGSGGTLLWMQAAGSTLASGKGWADEDEHNPLTRGRASDFRESPVVTTAAIALPAAVMLGGILVWWRRYPRWLLAAFLLPPGFMVLHATLKGTILLAWYLAPALPAILCLAAAALQQLCSVLLPARLQQTPAVPVLAVLLTAGLSLPWHAKATQFCTTEFEPNRAAVALTRHCINPRAPGAGTDAVTITLTQPRPGYDPFIREPRSLPEFLAILADAKGGTAPVIVHLGDAEFARFRYPEIMALVDSPAFFTPVATLHGLDHVQTRYLWKWTGALPAP